MRLNELPDCDDKKTLHNDKLIAFVSVEYDMWAGDEKPSTRGRFVSLNRRHTSFDREAFSKHRRDPDCVILSYYEHGDCCWFPLGQGVPGTDCPWDGVRIAGLWIPRADTMETLRYVSKTKGKKRRKLAEQMAKEDCELYTEWCNGHVYEVFLQVFEARWTESGALYDVADDYRFDEPVREESYSGVYLGLMETEAGIVSQINATLENIIKTHEI